MSLFKRRRFRVEIILLCVRWYCKYGLNYRDWAERLPEDENGLCDPEEL